MKTKCMCLFIGMLFLSGKAFAQVYFSDSSQKVVEEILDNYLEILKGCSYRNYEKYEDNSYPSTYKKTTSGTLTFSPQFNKTPANRKILTGLIREHERTEYKYDKADENERTQYENFDRSIDVTLTPIIKKSDGSYEGFIAVETTYIGNKQYGITGQVDFSTTNVMTFYADGNGQNSTYSPTSPSCSFIK